MEARAATPNHHADYPAFAGVAGLVAALSMAVGRKADARLAVRLSGMGSSDTVVDIGCGPGVAVRYTGRRRGAIVIGVDPAPVMLRVAKLLTRRSTKVRYVQGVAEGIPLPEHSASIVWSIATVHHWSDIDAELKKRAECSPPVVVWWPSSGRRNQGPEVTPVMAGMRNKAPPSWSGAGSMASLMSASSKRQSGADRRLAS